MYPVGINRKAERYGRLFELIRQENLLDKRRSRPSEESIRNARVEALRQAACDSLRPISAHAFGRD